MSEEEEKEFQKVFLGWCKELQEIELGIIAEKIKNGEKKNE